MSLVKRTRREALVLCKELWTEIRDKKLIDKREASVWKRIKTDPDKCDSCFACEHMITHKYTNCGDCILLSIWPSGCEISGFSPFIEWVTWKKITISKRGYNAADGIVKGCDEALATLDKKRGGS